MLISTAYKQPKFGNSLPGLGFVCAVENVGGYGGSWVGCGRRGGGYALVWGQSLNPSHRDLDSYVPLETEVVRDGET